MPVIIPPEGQTVEWKRSVGEWKEIVETCAAFATAQGGRIFVGVEDAGTVVGVNIGKGSLEDLANKIAVNTTPRIVPVLTVSEQTGKSLLIVDVPESLIKPVYAFDHAFRRAGRTNRRLSADEANRLYMDSRGLSWDETILPGIALMEINRGSVRRFLQTARSERRWSVSVQTSAEHVLKQLELYREDKLTVAAVLLFSKNPQRRLPQAELRCARFKGEQEIDFIDMAVIQGNIIDQVEAAMIFIQRNIRRAAKIEGLQRRDVWEYPMDALREAVVNAVCHRDYANAGNVQIRIFDNRLEVWNPGGLPDGWTVEDLKREHGSKPRNKQIAKVFFLLKYIEQFGTGTRRIINDCLAAGLPEPEFESRLDFFRVIFRPKPPEDIQIGAPELNERQKQALAFVEKHGRITTADLQELSGIIERTARRDLEKLVKLNILRKFRRTKNVWYEASEPTSKRHVRICPNMSE